jgi:hypothetical protein
MDIGLVDKPHSHPLSKSALYYMKERENARQSITLPSGTDVFKKLPAGVGANYVG